MPTLTKYNTKIKDIKIYIFPNRNNYLLKVVYQCYIFGKKCNFVHYKQQLYWYEFVCTMYKHLSEQDASTLSAYVL